MAARLLVIPYTAEPTLTALLVEQGFPLPDRHGRPVSVALVEEILTREGWQYRSRLVTGAWEAHFLAYGGRKPPIKELSLGPDEILDFGTGPLYGPWHVSREVARCCGPRVALLSSGDAVCLVTEATSYDTFHRAMTGRPVPADRSDLEWEHSDEERQPQAAKLPALLPTPEEALEVALSDRPGREDASTQVGRALQAYRWSGAQSPPLRLDAPRQRAIVQRLREHVRCTPVPAADLVWALGQADGTGPDLAALVERLSDADGSGDGAADGAPDGAAAAAAMARVFLR